MIGGDHPRLVRASLIRFVEEQLLRLFSEGNCRRNDTHLHRAGVVRSRAGRQSRRARDIIFSNHRCHGHYLAWTDDVDGLLAEVMGKHNGVCAGIGGSQHLCAKGFFSNGIQGSIVPVSAGLAYAQKLAGNNGIVAVCIGDGTLGEGVVYETFNIAAKWRLPLLVVSRTTVMRSRHRRRKRWLATSVLERRLSASRPRMPNVGPRGAVLRDEPGRESRQK